MLQFREWFEPRDTFGLTEGKKPHRSGKRGQRPDSRVDDFLNQIVGLAGDLDKASERSKQRELPQKPTVRATPGEEELLRLAKVALSNLKSSPEYYKQRPELTQGGGGASNGKVSRKDALRVAKELGVNFRDTEFNQEVFRKAIESEFNRRTAFSREYVPGKPLV